MPIFEYRCQTCVDVIEKYVPTADVPDPKCETCGGQRQKCISSFGIVGTGSLGGTKYNDRRLENYEQQGHWVYETDPKTGKRTIPRYLETFQDQREHCKREGLYNPGEIGQVEAGVDGKSFSCSGLPGAW